MSLRITVKLTPKGGRNAIAGWQTDAAGKRLLKARVCAPPEDGKANAALVALIAPDTTEADIDMHTEIFRESVRALVD